VCLCVCVCAVVLHDDSSFVTHFFLFSFFLCCFGTFACTVVAMVVITRAMIRKIDVRNRVRLRDYLSICVGYKVIEW